MVIIKKMDISPCVSLFVDYIINQEFALNYNPKERAKSLEAKMIPISLSLF